MISISVYGAVFVPVALWVFIFRPQYLVALLVVASVFVAAPVLDFHVGDSIFGVKPYYFVTILLAIRAIPLLLGYRQLKRRMHPVLKVTVSPLVGFWIWAVATSFLLPVIFRGTQVIDPRAVEGDVAAAFLQGESSALHWSFENLGQAAYLTLNLVAVLYVLGARQKRKASVSSVGVLRFMIVFVAVIACLQSIASWKGWDFPESIFNSDPAIANGSILDLESGVRRVSSTFNEPSYAGGFLAAGALGLLAARLLGAEVSLLVVLLAIIGLILTTATTGYAAFILGVGVLLIYLARGSWQTKLPRHFLRRFTIVVLLLAVGVGVLLAAAPPLRDAALGMTVRKADTISFAARTAVDLYSLGLLFKTYGLGVGLGSNRPSSFMADLLGNVGVIGTGLFVLFIVRLLGQLLARSDAQSRTGAFVMMSWMLVGILLAQTVALPDLSWPPLWAVLILATSVLASQDGASNELGNALKNAPITRPWPANAESA